MNQSVFDEYSNYYDLLYRDKNYVAEAEYVAQQLREWNADAVSVLELGSGTGKHALLLTERGYQVHGIERSAGMIERARALGAGCGRHAATPVFTQGDLRDVRLGSTFDAVISLFHVISYQVTNDDLLAAFRTARHHLTPGGVFLFDAWYGPAVLTERPTVRVKRASNDHIEVTRIAEPAMCSEDNVVQVSYEVFVRERSTGRVKETRETHRMRYLFAPEVELLARASRFALLKSEEWLTGTPLSSATWGACFVLRATA